MQAIEFEAEVENGVIEVPDHYRDQVGRNVRVILLTEKTEPPHLGALHEIFGEPLRAADFEPMSRDETHER